MHIEQRRELDLPSFTKGAIVKETPNYRVVMDYKPGDEGKASGQRFFIEPLSDEAERMLALAALKHNVLNINYREIEVRKVKALRKSLRADFIAENLPSLLFGVTQAPEEGADTIPSPERMEECLNSHPETYTFSG
ncbi:MAG: hypothetical protein A3B38_01000 [Candidatus Levybacteria bacterium RIFCSPLOWO2_01_FULL_36_13]|nr:MAG: hypothetical protein A2684_02240 [Candidatus Levybacteria bacterium RIFCSPHIGHO2_01_FULL_36_15b]OGH35465.1 MAG: hypothetical protein A3B38_01000 [Candidatus Levybacteria bacterium RIFCSPLOWO2_01_FULL_36_13]